MTLETLPDVPPMNLTYTQFVQSRVKWLPRFEDDILHACVGIVGEAIEFSKIDSDEVEELGDLYFYVEAFYLSCTKWGHELHPYEDPKNWYEGEIPQVRLNYLSGDVIDLAKKIWVYGKTSALPCLVGTVFLLEEVLDEIAAEIVDEDQIQPSATIKRENQRKLTLRYPTGYSDAAAIARADKVEGA